MKVRSTHRQDGENGERAASAAHGPAQRRQALAPSHYQQMASSSARTAQLMERAGMMAGAAPVQRVEEEEPLQGKFPAQRVEKPNHTGLPQQLKAGVESLSGMSLDHVKVHYNSDKPAQLNAHAYAQGSEIHVAPGQEQHLPHEAWHVVQQAQGRVQATMQMKEGTPVNDDAGLEREADVMGAKAMAVQLSADAMGSMPSIPGSATQRQVLQRTIGIGAGVAVEQKSLIYLAVQLTNYMGDYDYARTSLTALDGNNYDTMILLQAAMPAPLTADQVFIGGAAVTIVGIGGRCNEHMTQGGVVAELRRNKAAISIANGNDQRIQIGRGLVDGWKWGYVCLKFAGGQLRYWHAHDGFQVG